MWKIEAKARTKASPSQVWKLWTDVSSWPKWDHELEWVCLEGPFRQGTKGALKPKKGPKVKFTLVEVSPNRGFADETTMPFTKIVFSHKIVALDNGEFEIVHSAEAKGLLAPLLKVTLGKTLQKEMPKAVNSLVKHAEKISIEV